MLSAVYIKGFKTFARPVRMPLEGGVTAIVGPNGSGKSNVTDAVLFALGEQSPGVLRAGSMGDLIFSGSEMLPAASVAEVALVLDNENGAISLPYGEVSISRRISRGGDTEYRINGSRARLADVRAVAGEAGLGRHSILRQGAVDAIVAGGAAGCRLALEEAAGLGVYRRRRLSASRRLDRADTQLKQIRQLEVELAGQLRRIEREAVAAREYRELEGRYRKLSLAHLYRVASQGLDERRVRLERDEKRVLELASVEASLREEESRLAAAVGKLEGVARELEVRLEGLEDLAEDLQTETLRADRLLFRVESSDGGEQERRRAVSGLSGELKRVTHALAAMERELARIEEESAVKQENRARLRQEVAVARKNSAALEEARSRLAGELERARAGLERAVIRAGELGPVSPEYLEMLSGTVEDLENAPDPSSGASSEELRDALNERQAIIESRGAEISRRQGVLEAALGRAESRIRALRDPRTEGPGPRLHEVIRPRPGFEGAVEAALGDYAGGVLAENLSEGLRLLSKTERFALRLDARPLEAHDPPPGTPLLDCVDLIDDSYAEAVRHLLGGIYVVEDPRGDHPENGHVVVTRSGLRLTRTSVSLRQEGGGRFSREARLADETRHLESLKTGPGGILYDCRDHLSSAAGRLDATSDLGQKTLALKRRATRTAANLVREARLRHSRAGRARDRALEIERETDKLRSETSHLQQSVQEVTEAAEAARGDLAGLSSAAAGADAAHEDHARRRTRLRRAISEGSRRRDEVSSRLKELGASINHDAGRPARVAARATETSRSLVAALRERRNATRAARSEITGEQRRAAEERTALSRRAVELAAELATARAAAEHAKEDLHQAETSATEALDEIQTEWGATLEDARRESEENSDAADVERHRLARKLKRFGDVNLLALSQQESLRERHEFVAAQRADAEAASDELDRIIHDVDVQIETRFSQTFRDVRSAFGEMVPRMMEGAAGVLDFSEEGVEIGLRLGRKGWRPLHVLSGGERALLALSFLFSIFLSRPGSDTGAFCILDEAEAALDDLNLARFLAVVDSYRSQGQFLLVTHQKRTMAAADVLYGVVQDAAGATTVVSKRMQGE